MDKEKNLSSLEKIKSQKSNLINYLSKKYDAEVFDGSATVELLNKNVVLDSNIVSVQKINDEYLIKAEINIDSDKKYYAYLKCDDAVIEKFYNTKTNKVLIAAKINSFNEVDMLADADSLSGGKSLVNLGKSILLYGECLALVENSFTNNAN